MANQSGASRLAADLGIEEGSPASMYLANLNPYFKSLANPTKYIGARIPDQVVSPSVTFVVKQKLTSSVGAGGVATVAFGCGNDAPSFGSLIPGAPNYSSGAYTTAATEASIMTTAVATGFPDWTSAGSIPRRYRYVRLVSAAVTFRVMSSPGRSSGVLLAGWIPKQTFDQMRGGISVSTDILAKFPGIQSYSVSGNKNVTIRYLPADESVRQYVDINVTITTGLAAGRFPGVFIATVRGADVGNVLQGNYHGNYEAIPRYEQDAVGAAVSKYDPRAIDNAVNMGADMDVVSLDPKIAVPESNEDTVLHGKRGPPDVGVGDTMMERMFTQVDKWPDSQDVRARVEAL